MNTTRIATKLRIKTISIKWASTKFGETHAAVAAKMSFILAEVVMLSENEKTTVKIAIIQNRVRMY